MYYEFRLLFCLGVLLSAQAFAQDVESQWLKDPARPSVQQNLSLHLNNLSPFSDIVVIQRRYLVKTGRFEISPSTLFLFSNEFFINAGVGGGLSFYFLEKHGLELRGFYTLEFPRSVQIDVFQKLGFKSSVAGDRTIYFFGLVYKWIPVYGKMAWFNRKIIPFEMSVFFGGGLTRVRCPDGPDAEVSFNSPESESIGAGGIGQCETIDTKPFRDEKGEEKLMLIRQKTEPTVLFGVGQSYAISRNLAFRLDINWQYYGMLLGGQTHHWDILMTSGLSFYFPRRRVR